MTNPHDPAGSTGARLVSALEFVVKTAAIGVPIFYALGRVYVESYWGALSLPSTLMGYSVDDYLYFGFLSIIVWVSHLLGVGPYSVMAKAVLIGLGIGIVSAIAAWVDRWLSRRLSARAAAFRERLVEAQQSEHASTLHGLQVGAIVSSGVSFLLLSLLGAVALVFLPLLLAANTGKAQAKADLDRLAGHHAGPTPAQPMTQAHYTEDGQRVSVPLLECAEVWCVVVRQGIAVAIPRTDLVAIDHDSAVPDVAPSSDAMKFPVDTPPSSRR